MENQPPSNTKPPKKKPLTPPGDSIDYVAETAALVRSKAAACRYGGGNAKVCRKLEALADVIDPLFEAPPPLGDGSSEPAPAPAKDAAAKPSKSKKPAPKKAAKEVDEERGEERGDDLVLEHDDEAE
jgi:hypothetical protein